MSARAVERALSLVGSLLPYKLGTGNHRGPTRYNNGPLGFDCWGLAGSFAFEQPRHEPGFNKGPWATVSDDRNCDSAIEEAEHIGKAYQVVLTPRVGDLLVMPSIRDKNGKRIRIGHVWLVVGVPAEWDEAAPQYSLLDTVQCQASTKPAIKRGPGPRSDATTFRGLINEEWRVRILRVQTRPA
jgi:hypothetical protein